MPMAPLSQLNVFVISLGRIEMKDLSKKKRTKSEMVYGFEKTESI